MMAKLFLLINIFIVFAAVTANHLECKYENDNWFYIFGKIYKCQVKSLVIDSKKSTFIALVDGIHMSNYENNDVLAFKAARNTIKYFPRGLEILFPNIKNVYIHFCGLQEVTQDDLQSLTNLVSLDLWGNDIQTISEDLFKFNSNLAHISFTDNKLTYIHPQVFNNLDGLVNLFLDKTRDFDWEPCDNIRIENDRDAVVKAVKELNPKCYELSELEESEESNEN